MANITKLTKLVDAQAMARQHPDNFRVPSPHELAMIVPGTYVKVCRAQERFWIQIRGGNGKYLFGLVDFPLVDERNDDVPGGLVRIEHRHIYEILQVPPS